MAFLLKNNSIFLHIPKTGGSFVKKVLLDNKLIIPHFFGLNSYRIGENKHIDLSQTISILTSYKKLTNYPFAKISDTPFIFIFVRHPKAWYESYFKYLTGINFKKFGEVGNIRNMHPLSPLNELYEKDFNEFMNKILDKEPHFLTKLYFRYSHSHLISFVGKTENMSDDLRNILSYIAPKSEHKIVIPDIKVNESKRISIQWDANLLDKMMDQERLLLKTYNYN